MKERDSDRKNLIIFFLCKWLNKCGPPSSDFLSVIFINISNLFDFYSIIKISAVVYSTLIEIDVLSHC
jgi:hypothetical protein